MTVWLRTALITLGLSSTPVAIAQETPADWRWFEVEVLAFKQAPNSDAEAFPWHAPRQVDARHDPLSGYYAPNFFALLNDLPLCPNDEESISMRPVFCAQADEVDPFATPWYQPSRILSGFAQAPQQVIDGLGGDMLTSQGPYLMPAETHLFNDFREQLVRRNVGTPLLHVTYRTPVFSRSEGYTVRLFGGRNFGNEFLPSGYEQPPFSLVETAAIDTEQQPQLFEELELLLSQINQQQIKLSYRDHGTPNPPPLLPDRERSQRAEPVWELDGTLHIYLVGNYLHIDSDLELRSPQQVQFNQRELAAQVEQALQTNRSNSRFLRSYRLDQLRRVISHETHYFDHPNLGLVVQIRRTDLSARR
ncbi:Peptidoglycan-binding protein, CsiV [Pseudidiomarina maritima]|uniref:Peptidoglycan-binding protein, CsiV n=1 Tax=Pseudidiomarina maritima TaxID=519453 RepID=A0A1I6G6Q3_9GAMM|nr:CsiV family protein [Pseudidiomarina maritima]SFR37862.1 Peptidoglycan-binding protein, CsiV [Pseudidiomarina maritima]